MEQLVHIDRWDGIASEGGPLILMSASAMAFWDGARPAAPVKRIEARFRYDDPEAPATDYDRACDIEGYLGVVHVGEHEALVIGDDPSSTIIVPSKSGRSLLIAKWDYGPDQSSVVASMARISLADFPPAELSIRFRTSPLVMFDSAVPGDEIEQLQIAELPAGTYEVSTLLFRPESKISLVFHWLRPTGHAEFLSDAVDRTSK